MTDVTPPPNDLIPSEDSEVVMTSEESFKDKAAKRAHLQQQLQQARQEAAEFEAQSVKNVLDIIADDVFRAKMQEVALAAEDLITPGIKLQVFNMLKGFNGLDKMLKATRQAQ